ncbi:hypothetical protein KKG24_02515 [Patescibacteria group bacterium]|nr:hypothetical protein [Patescibacteria group bacterium]
MENNTMVDERTEKDKQALLEILKEVPIIQIACKKAGISRATYYRWRKEDKGFMERSDNALAEGVEFINDMSESQLISLIRQRSWPAISFWLRKCNPKFKDRIEVSGKIETPKNELTPEQQAIVTEALRLASLNVDEGAEEINNNENKKDEK